MEDLLISGGKPLSGEISVQGSKNSALPMMAASLLFRGVSVLYGCPKIADVYYMTKILEKLGAVTWWEENDLYLDCTLADGTEIPMQYAKKMRSSIILVGCMLARSKKGVFCYPGGCVIGKRPVDQHILVLKKLGADITEKNNYLYAKTDGLCGNELMFTKISLGATEQGILSAVTAEGDTILRNCSIEPEIMWLCKYLKGMGANITGEETGTIYIRGTKLCKGGKMQVPADRIVAGTYICAAAATRGEIVLNNAPLEEMKAFLDVYSKMGGQYKVESGKLNVYAHKIGKPIPMIETEVYPGFPTDLQSLLMSVLITVTGESRMKETIFEERFKAAYEMCKLGADIRMEGDHVACIYGGRRLSGTHLVAQDLRGGAALMIAALAAEGESRFEGYHFIQRGYEDFYQKLCALGSNIKKGAGNNIYEFF